MNTTTRGGHPAAADRADTARTNDHNNARTGTTTSTKEHTMSTTAKSTTKTTTAKTTKAPAAKGKTTRARGSRAAALKAAAAAPVALFDVTTMPAAGTDQADQIIQRIPIAQIELATNPRKHINQEGIDRLAALMMRNGQFVPAIGRRVADDKVLLYAGQRRKLAVEASKTLAGTEGYENLKPLAGLIVLLLDYEPTAGDVRRIQAQENAREDLTVADQVQQFRDCWEDRVGASHDERLASVCDDLGIGIKKGQNLLKCMALPEDLRDRVSDRPSGDELSIGMANVLSEMQETSRPLTEAVAARITNKGLHDSAMSDMGAFINRTVLEDEGLYAVRIDLGTMLDAHAKLEQAIGALDDEATEQIASLFREEMEEDKGPKTIQDALAKLSRRTKDAALKITVDDELRTRASAGNFGYVHHRGTEFADTIWVTDPAFMIDHIRTLMAESKVTNAREESYFAKATVDSDELAEVAKEAAKDKEERRKREDAAIGSNLGLGADIGAALVDLHSDQLKAMRDFFVHLMIREFGEIIAYGAGWTDRQRQQPVGETMRYEPRSIDAILEAEKDRALNASDPMVGIAHLVSRFFAAYMLDVDGVTKTKALGSDRMMRKLREGLPGGNDPMREAAWAFMRPILSQHLAQMHVDAFVMDNGAAGTVDLTEIRGETDLADLDLGDEQAA